MRLNRFLAESGLFSRREADKKIEMGLVFVNGGRAVLGQKVELGDQVFYQGKKVSLVEAKIYIAFHKPPGIEVTMNKQVEHNIADFLDLEERVFPVGRLDKESEGLLLLTNDGDTANQILKAANGHEKEYIVTVNKSISAGFVKAMERGVPILDTVTGPCKVTVISKDTFGIILTQGLNRQIRRMCEALGYKVKKLVRIRIMHLELGALTQGKWRALSDDEIKRLKSVTQ